MSILSWIKGIFAGPLHPSESSDESKPGLHRAPGDASGGSAFEFASAEAEQAADNELSRFDTHSGDSEAEPEHTT